MKNSFFLVENLICHLLGNISVCIYYLGKKSYDEVLKEDNSKVGFIVAIIQLVILIPFLKHKII
jgi:hypothetical protein